jgi:uncharacterized protein (DUF433 family)
MSKTRHKPRHKTLARQPPASRQIIEKIGRGEWIRTTDLLVPNQELTQDQQLSNRHCGCDPLLHVPTAERVSGESELGRGSGSQRLHAETGHSRNIRRGCPNSAPVNTTRPSLGARISVTSVSINSVIYSFLDGRRPEEIQAEHPTLRLSQVYALIAFYLEQKETDDHRPGDRVVQR